MENHRPNRIPWPPLIYLSAVVLGILLYWLWPLGLGNNRLVMVLGVLLAVAAVIADVLTIMTFRKHQTTIMPHKAATHLITVGPFAWSRNPIYLSNTALVVAAGLIFSNLWLIILALAAAVLTQKLAIEREERHLAAKFGAEWSAYAARVRRWL